MPRRTVSRSRCLPSSAYPPKKLLAASDGAFSRTSPNDSVSVTDPGMYSSVHSNSMRSRREPRLIEPICSPCRCTSSLSATSAIPVGRFTGIECHAESDAKRFQRAQQTGDVHRAPAGLQPVEVEPVVGVRLREIFLRDAACLAHGADSVADITRLTHLDRPTGHATPKYT